MAVQRTLALLALVAAPAAGAAADLLAGGPNPIRKVTTVLENMQKKITEEGKTEKKLYDKFMCHCKGEQGDLKKSIAAREKRFPNLDAELKAAQQLKIQLEGEIKQSQADRANAEKAVADATALREKESKAFEKDSAEQAKTIEAVNKAVKALAAGVAKKAPSFLQSGELESLRQLTDKDETLDDGAREEILAFLQGDESYDPASGEVLGMLKQMGEQMEKDLAKTKAQEAASIKGFESLKAAKAKEIKALGLAIESKTQRVGETAVSIVQIKHDMGDGMRILNEDKAFLADLEKSCSTKTAEFEERVKTRNEELTALAETVKLLTSDDALDLFKKTMKKKPASFLQVGEVKEKALTELHSNSHRFMNHVGLDLLTLALKGKAVGFEKVVSMIDDMVKTIKAEQVADDKKKDYCAAQIQKAVDKSKDLGQAVADKDTAITGSSNSIAGVVAQIKKIQESIKKLDKDVELATAQRKAENTEFQDLVNSNRAAMDLLGVAKNRLNKFYNPSLAKKAFIQAHQAPATTTVRPGRAAAPETFKGPYAKKGEESNGVIGLLTNIIHDLDKENAEATTNEKVSQKAYEKFLKDSADKRALEFNALTTKAGEKGFLEGALADQKSVRGSTQKELMASKKLESSLHSECDMLVANFDTFKEARTSEIESLGRAKATLLGAKFSFGQIKATGFLAKRA